MSNIREYIKCFLDEEFNRTHPIYSYGPLISTPSRIVSECEDIREAFGPIPEEMELSYFGLSSDGAVNGGAWIGTKEGVFNFAIATTEKAPEFIFEELIQDCVEEFLALREKYPKIKLGIEDEDTLDFLKENYSLNSLDWQWQDDYEV